jgi:hypothetical protein
MKEYSISGATLRVFSPNWKIMENNNSSNESVSEAWEAKEQKSENA